MTFGFFGKKGDTAFMKQRIYLGIFLAVLLPYLLFEFLRMNDSIDRLFVLPRGHFYIVSFIAVLATIISAAVGVAGIKLRNLKVIFLSLSFISLAEVFSVHGLSTPNFILGSTHVPGIAAQTSILLAGLWLYLSSMPTDHRLIAYLSRYQLILLPAWVASLFIFGLFSMIFTHFFDHIPLDDHPLNFILATTTIVLIGIAMYRYLQSYWYSRFPLQLSIVYSSGWLIVSQIIMVIGELWRISWWLYHLLLLLAMAVMLLGLIKQYATSQSMISALRSLFTTDPIERITSSLSPSVKALVIATENKDVYTAGHNLRVTLYALKIAEELGLGQDMLRAIAQGTIVHDVGKINIPDSILNKPGRLTPEERSIIETHPVKGYEMCKNLGFMKEELEIIRSHHEKWDGSGYPDQLRRESIPLLARVVAVADVYDALTSTRSYRKAWSHEEAVGLLQENSGSHFDPKCVEAWVNICQKDPCVYQYPLERINEQTHISEFSQVAIK